MYEGNVTLGASSGGYAITAASNTVTTTLSPSEIIRQGEQSMLNRCIAELYEEAAAETWSEDERIAILTVVARLKEFRTEAIADRRRQMEMEEKRVAVEMEKLRYEQMKNTAVIDRNYGMQIAPQAINKASI
jgi:hypothetical protein